MQCPVSQVAAAGDARPRSSIQGRQSDPAGSCFPDPSALAEIAGTRAGSPAQGVSVKVGKLNLVDLAGSERVHITGATGAKAMPA